MRPIYPSGSLRLEARVAFGGKLDEALRTRKVSAEFVGRALGVKGSTVRDWRRGNFAPLPETAKRLANLLKWRSLYRLAVAARTQTCLSCGDSFVDRGNGPSRFCRPDCRKVRLKTRTAVSVERRAAHLERVAADLVEGMQAYFRSVERFCRECEPEGVCHASGCSLRAVSPLPLGGNARGVLTADPVQSAVLEADRARRTEAARRAAEGRWSQPGAREAQSARAIATLAAMSPEQKAEWRRKISTAKLGASRRVA